MARGARFGRYARGARAGGLPADAAQALGLPARRRRRRGGHHALYQHDPFRPAARISRRPRPRTPHQAHHPLERDGDGGAGEPAEPRHRRPHLDLRLGRHALRSGLQPFLPRQGRPPAARPSLFPRPRRAGHLCAGVSLGPAERRTIEELPPRVAARAGPVVVSAPLADARFLGVSHRVDGPGTDHGHLSGAVQSLLGRSRHQTRRRGVARVGLPGRRRMRRAGSARRDHAGRPRTTRQPDLRHQLQPPAARRPRARQRQDDPGTGRGVPRRRLERHQGDLGLRLGPAFGPRRRRPAGAPHGRRGRWAISEIRGQRGRLYPAAFLRRRSAARSAWRPT